MIDKYQHKCEKSRPPNSGGNGGLQFSYIHCNQWRYILQNAKDSVQSQLDIHYSYTAEEQVKAIDIVSCMHLKKTNLGLNTSKYFVQRLNASSGLINNCTQAQIFDQHFYCSHISPMFIKIHRSCAIILSGDY